MLITYIIISAIMLVVSFILYKFFKKIFHVIFYVFFIFFMLLVIGGILVYMDAKDFKDNYSTSKNLFILYDNNTIYAAIQLDNTNENTFNFFTEQQISNYQKLFSAKNYEMIRSENYKVVFINAEMINDFKEKTVKINDITIDNDTAFRIWNSNEPEKIFVEQYVKQNPKISNQSIEQMEQEMKKQNSNEQLKAYVFAVYLQNLMDGKSILMIFSEMKKGNLYFYPETAMFKMIKYTPNSLINDTLNAINKNQNQNEKPQDINTSKNESK